MASRFVDRDPFWSLKLYLPPQQTNISSLTSIFGSTYHCEEVFFPDEDNQIKISKPPNIYNTAFTLLLSVSYRKICSIMHQLRHNKDEKHPLIVVHYLI
jgi:hypothetical protein